MWVNTAIGSFSGNRALCACVALEKTAVIVHISQLAAGTTLKRWLKTVPQCWDGCFTEPAFTHYSCGQAGAAGRTITPESRNATALWSEVGFLPI